MNKFYYPIILVDNMPEIILAMSNEILFLVIIVLQIIFLGYFAVKMYLSFKTKGKCLFTKDLFYVVSIWFGILFSMVFIWFLAVPFIFYFEILTLTIYNKENYNKMVNNHFTIISIIIFIFISILLNFVLGTFG